MKMVRIDAVVVAAAADDDDCCTVVASAAAAAVVAVAVAGRCRGCWWFPSGEGQSPQFEASRR